MSLDSPKIFLSSTYVDLHGEREELRRWLSGVFDAAMVIMESFGSDAEPPNVISVGRVRECDIFIGIYAHRYGTIDPATGSSITELELDEARRAYSAGVIKSILLYVIEGNSAWLSDSKDQSIEAEHGRLRLREKLSHHTYTPFKGESDLLFYVIRDVYRLIARNFPAQHRRIKSLNIPPQRKLSRPIGMEFLTSADRAYLIGRQDEISEAIAQLEREPITLLLGESGTGKTSLLHAGIIPEAVRRGWRPVYARPFGMPCRNIVEQIESSIFMEGRRNNSLLQTVAEAMTALDDVPLLLIIDQFEDVLSSPSDAELNDLASGLAALRELSAPGLRVIITYRSDLEGRLGGLWQRISGSARGFPRIYLSGVRPEALWPAVRTFCEDLSIELPLHPDEVERICRDVVVVSREVLQFGIYPPYLQMLLDDVWHTQQGATTGQFTFIAYESGGRINGIINRYLAHQLQYANDTTGELRLLLIALVKSYGVKAQRTLQELAADTEIDPGRCEPQLERLIDLRLVRHISDRYEASHDFLAKMILEKLVDFEEREFKRFRELLTSRAGAFAATSGRLSVEEVLFLYKFRQRIAFNEQEAVLILDTWVMGDVPGLYWIKDFDAKLVEQHLVMPKNTELTPEQQYSVLFLKTHFMLVVSDDDFIPLFRTYKIASEAAVMIRHFSETISDRVIWLGLRNERTEIRNACYDVVLLQMQRGNITFLRSLRNSAGTMYTDAYFRLVLNGDLPNASKDELTSREQREFAWCQVIARARSLREAREGYRLLCAMRPTDRVKRFANALVWVRGGHINNLINKIRRASVLKSKAYIAALESAVTDFERILHLYILFNGLERGRDKTPAICKKAQDVAELVRRMASPSVIPALRDALQQIRLTPSSKDIAASILENGGKDDVVAILLKVADSREPTYYENQAEMCQSLACHMRSFPGGVPDSLLECLHAENFWEFIPAEQRRTGQKAMLPVRHYRNRVLFIRIVAHAIIGLARRPDDDALRRLINHQYITVARPAAERLSELMGEAALSVLASEIDRAVLSRRGVALAEALRLVERGLYSKLRSAFENG